jgi:hypothetical protein
MKKNDISFKIKQPTKKVKEYKKNKIIIIAIFKFKKKIIIKKKM